MEYLQFTDFRNRSKEYFQKIEEGKSYIIVKKGKPIAKIIPFEPPKQGWKREVKRVRLHATTKTTTDYLTEERRDR